VKVPIEETNQDYSVRHTKGLPEDCTIIGNIHAHIIHSGASVHCNSAYNTYMIQS